MYYYFLKINIIQNSVTSLNKQAKGNNVEKPTKKILKAQTILEFFYSTRKER